MVRNYVHPPKVMFKVFKLISKVSPLRTPAFFGIRILYILKRAYYELKIKNLQSLAPRLAVVYEHTRRRFLRTPQACH